MRIYLSLIIITLCFVAFKTKAQCSTPITFSIQVTPPTCSGCCDGSAQVINASGGCGAHLIQWSTTPTQYGLTASGLCSGSYSVTIYDSGCCPSAMQICSVPQGGSTGINENYLENTLTIFPNPNNGNFVVLSNLVNEHSIVKMYNFLGQKKDFNFTISNNSIHVNIKDVTKGIYWLEIRSDNNLICKKVMIE